MTLEGCVLTQANLLFRKTLFLTTQNKYTSNRKTVQVTTMLIIKRM